MEGIERLRNRWGTAVDLAATPVRRLRKASKDRERQNIRAHYDLGNDFFGLFLDETMMYSAAVFPTPDASLTTASMIKLDRICDKLELTEDDHLLEIGTGWGGMAVHDAKTRGCRVTTTTISAEQHRYAKQLIADEGLAHLVDVLELDYRDVEVVPAAPFTKAVSIEMIEAVDWRDYGTYFDALTRLVAADGWS